MTRISALIAAVCLLATAQAAAQDAASPPGVVDLAALLRIVRDASPRLAIERQTIAGAQADRVTAGAYPNPTLNYGRLRQNSGAPTVINGTRQQDTTVDLPLLIAGQRSARIGRADLAVEAARARVASGASTLSAEAGAAFVALLAAQEKESLLGTANREFERLRDIVAGREASGMASRYDRTRLDVELGALRAKLEESRAGVADRAGELAALVGIPDWRPRAQGALQPLDLDAAALANLRERAASSPAGVAALREEEAARSGIDVASRERWPVPSISVGRTWTSEPYGSANFLGLSVEIPVFDTRRGALDRARAEATAATLRRELAVSETAANLERYAGVITARRAALQRFDDESARQLPALRQMAEDAYRLGRGSILELLDSMRSRHEIQQTRIELAAALIEAQIRFLALSGGLERNADPQAAGAARR